MNPFTLYHTRTHFKACSGARWFAVLTLFWLFVGSARSFCYVIDRTAATVNNDVILESDIDKFMKKVKSKSFQELFGGINENALQSRKAVLELLIEEKIINQQVKKLDLGASDQEVDGQIHAIESRNGITDAQLRSRLTQLGTTMAEYREGIRRQIERNNLVQREIRPMMESGDEQLRHYYLRHLKPEDEETQYEIAQILIENKPKNGVSAEKRARQIWEIVSKDPVNFEKYAREYSDDSDTASNGGKLGSFSLSSLATEFRAVVPKTPIGSISSPIHTGAGFHIVKVLDTQKGNFASLSKERKEALRNQMVQSELESKMAMWLERKKRDATINRYEEKSTDIKNETTSTK